MKVQYLFADAALRIANRGGCWPRYPHSVRYDRADADYPRLEHGWMGFRVLWGIR